MSEYERVEKALEALHAALDKYSAQDRKDMDLGLIFDVAALLSAQADQASKVAVEHEHVGLEREHRFYLDRFFEARQGIIARLVDAAAAIARDYPYRGQGAQYVGEHYTAVATQILKEVALVSVNTRADLLVQYAHRSDVAEAQE